MKVHLLKKSIIIVLPFLLAFSAFCDTTHQVKKGDTLYSISKKYELTVEEIKAANNLSDSDVIKAGQKLIIPDADISTAAALSSTKSNNKTNNSNVKTKDHVVQKGETLYGIAKANGLSVADLMALNNLDSSDVLKAGQVLKVKETSNSSNASSKKEEHTVPKDVVVPEKAPDTRKYGDILEYDSNVVWPVVNPTVTQVKGKIAGVQLSAKSKEPVVCIHEGTVMYVGTYRGYGQVLFVQSKTGLIYAYTGLGSIKVKKGEYVVAGDKIGTAGIDSITGKPQITFMVFQNGNPIDPAKAPRSF